MASDPTGSVEYVHVASPVVTETGALLHNVVAPDMKVTVPPSGMGVIDAVNMTDLPNTEGFCEELTPVVVEVICGDSPAFPSTVISFPTREPPLLPFAVTSANRPLPVRSSAASASGPKPTG